MKKIPTVLTRDPAMPDALAVRDVLARYELVTQRGIVFALCRRCPHLTATARDIDGSQDGVTYAEVAAQALRHELEDHSAGAPAGLAELVQAVETEPEEVRL